MSRRFLRAGALTPLLTGNARKGLALSALMTFSFTLVYFALPPVTPATYVAPAALSGAEFSDEPQGPIVIHLPTPKPLRGIYMTQCVAGTRTFREDLVRLIEETELNAVVIDIKDYSGKISFPTDHPLLRGAVSDRCGAPDMQTFIAELHKNGIYVIGRITVFQDPHFTKLHPELSVQKESTRSVWKDYKGLSFVDMGAVEFWDYIVALSEESYAIGFDELNYDYVRYPSDGDMGDIYYPLSEERLLADPVTGKARVLRSFFSYLNQQLSSSSPDAVLSVDLFGMTTTNTDDLNIGQILEFVEPYFDYIAPMVYPSHYPPTFNGWADPNQYPYDVVKFSMDRAIERLIAASSTSAKLRPWLQDFDYGGNYDIPEVKAQIQATYDAGLTSWMLWSASNIYTEGALGTENVEPALPSE